MFCLWEGVDAEASGYEVVYPLRFELRERRADLEFLTAAKGVAERINSVTLLRELNKLIARVSLVDDAMIEKIDRELGRKVGGAVA